MAQVTVQWFGQSFFKVQAGDVTVAIDPYDAATGLKPPRFNADLLLVTHEHHDHNNRDTIMGKPFEISGPGEFEVKGVSVYGVAGWHDDKHGAERGANTMYRFEIDGVRFLHLGDCGQKSLTNTQLELLSGIDVLLVPVGGTYTVNGSEAVELIEQLEPELVVPMHYQIPGLKVKETLDGVEPFSKALGLPVVTDTKLKLQKKDMQIQERRLVVLTPSV